MLQKSIDRNFNMVEVQSNTASIKQRTFLHIEDPIHCLFVVWAHLGLTLMAWVRFRLHQREI